MSASQESKASERGSQHEFTITRVFDASRETLWRAWTDPDFAALWWHPRGVISPREEVEIDARAGGSYSYTMINEATGEKYPTAGRYLEVVEPERLVFTWAEPGAGDDAPVVTVDLNEVVGGTEMVFHLRGVEAHPGDDNIYDGWVEALAILAEQLAA